MSFSVGFIDKLFGEKIELEIPDGNGNVIKRTVTKKWYDKMVREGKFSTVKEEIIKVHMLHPFDGYIILNWVVGVDIPEETVAKFINDEGELYALTVFEDGEQNVMVITKEMFDNAYERFSEI